MHRLLLCLVAASLLLPACGRNQGLRATPDGTGPRILIDWDAEPLPELPFPNDLATRPDPTSPTGLRLNFSEMAATEVERRARRKVNELPGFGIFAPISVRFEQPLDLDNIAQRHVDDYDTSDDAFFIIDVTPGSPTWGQPVELDVGHGRFPGDLFGTDAYFPNDPRAWTPSLLYELEEEDLNGNGVLDPGEDTDYDGVLDHPNVYPKGGDPRLDLMTWYERESDTLIFRPVVPMREQTCYAVVLTERLVGEDGQPIRSPWAWVHHLRQTEALEPLAEVLPALGLSVEDVAFAWTFTTGNITGDLVDVRRGLHGEGPFASLATDYPAGIYEAVVVREGEDVDNPLVLPSERLVTVLETSGFFPDEASDVLVRGYDYAESFVGGAFTSPDLMADRDDDGRDTADEWWKLDAMTGEIHAEPRRIAFTCIVPKASEQQQQPFPVTIYGHGYRSNRAEFLLFGWAMNRIGVAACSLDFPGHGVVLNDDERELMAGLMDAMGLLPFLLHLEDGRARDLDNDGRPDSGSDMWVADGFHTRDMVRQAVVDWMQFVRGLRACGSGTMGALPGGPNSTPTQERLSCDWDGDGTPDIGGPDVQLHLMGGSLGGINAAIAAAVEPEFTTTSPIVAGGGLMDIGWRSDLGGVVEAVVGKVMSPLVLGRADPGGGIRITQYLSSWTSMGEAHIATLPTIPAGGTVRVENLDNGEVRETGIPTDGLFRVGVPSDAMDYAEKRLATGMPDTGPVEGAVYEVAENAGVGDRWRITVTDAAGAEVAVIDSFEQDVTFQGLTHRAGSPLVALAEGLGHKRGTPALRRLVNVLSLTTEPGDPIAYAPHYIDEPFEKLGGQPVNILLVPTPGDPVVPTGAGIAIARAANIYDRHAIDERYGTTVDRWLIDMGVVHGMEEFGPWQIEKSGEYVLFDADDLDNGTDGTGAPSDIPLRAVRESSSGVSGLRLPYASAQGMHGFEPPDSSKPFDMTTFAIMQIVRFAQTGGQEISDDPCLETADCAFFPVLEDNE
jgi:hypothetical protein